MKIYWPPLIVIFFLANTVGLHSPSSAQSSQKIELVPLGGHTQSVRSLAISSDDRLALSVGADAVRLWDVATGVQLRSFGQNKDPQVAAFSPQNDLILFDECAKYASKRCLTRSLSLWDTKQSSVLRKFEADTQDISAVAFSRNGGALFSAACDQRDGDNRCLNSSIRVWDTNSGQELRRIESQSEPIGSVVVSDDGRFLISVGGDGNIRLWDPDRATELSNIAGVQGPPVAFFQAGMPRVIGRNREGLVTIRDVKNGAEIRNLDKIPQTHSLIGFNRDYTRLITEEIVNAGPWNYVAEVVVWDLETQQQLFRFQKAQSKFPMTVGPSAYSSEGDFILTAHDTAIKQIDGHGGQLKKAMSGKVSLGGLASFSPDGASIAWLSGDGTLSLWDSHTARQIWRSPSKCASGRHVFSPDGRVIACSTTGGFLQSFDAETGKTLFFLQAYVEAYGQMRKITFSSDSRAIISNHGKRGRHAWDARTGKRVDVNALDSDAVADQAGEHRPATPSRGRSNAISRDGLFIVSVEGVLVIRNAKTRDELIRLLTSPEGDWMAITPAGFFASSIAGAEMLSIVKGFQPYSVRQFYDHLYRPDLVEELLKGDPWGKYKDAASTLNLETILNSGAAPKLELLEKRTEKAEDTVKLAVRIKDAGGGIGGKVVWRVNGKTQGDLTTPGLQGPSSPARAVVMSQTLKVDPGKSNSVEVTAYNNAGLLASPPLRITVDPFGVTTTERPRLHVLAVGVDQYAMRDLELHYAVKDATAFAEAMQSVGSNLFSEVKVTALHDRNVTRSGLEAAVNTLAGEVKPTDVFILFLSGHGRSIAGKYYFLQQDLEFAKGQSIEHDAINQDLWQEWLAKIPAQKTLLIYDTCESAAASGLVRGGQRERETAMEQLQNATGQNLIAAARQAAFEGYQGHGVLTYALLEAFQKIKTDGAEVQKVDVDGLAGYVGDKVPEITQVLFGQRQEPLRKLAGNNFPLGLKILPPPAPSVAECRVSDQQSEPSHIIARSIRPRTKPSDDAATEHELVENTLVTIKACEGPWALITKRGKELGYVPISEMKPVY